MSVVNIHFGGIQKLQREKTVSAEYTAEMVTLLRSVIALEACKSRASRFSPTGSGPGAFSTFNGSAHTIPTRMRLHAVATVFERFRKMVDQELQLIELRASVEEPDA